MIVLLTRMPNKMKSNQIKSHANLEMLMQPSAAKHHLHSSPESDQKKSNTNPHDIGKSD